MDVWLLCLCCLCIATVRVLCLTNGRHCNSILVIQATCPHTYHSAVLHTSPPPSPAKGNQAGHTEQRKSLLMSSYLAFTRRLLGPAVRAP